MGLKNAALESLCNRKLDDFKAVRALLRLGRKYGCDFGGLWDSAKVDVFLMASKVDKLLPKDTVVPKDATFSDLVSWIVDAGFNDEIGEIHITSKRLDGGSVEYLLVYHDNIRAGGGLRDCVRIDLGI